MRAALLLLLINLSARGAELACPSTLNSEEKLKQSYAGWTEGRADAPRSLSAITIFDGNPKEMASLVGDQRKTSRTTMVSTWKLEAGTQYWITCSYSGTRITLSRQIPSSYRTCVITYGTDVTVDGLPEIRKFECR